MHGLQQILATVEEFRLWPLDLAHETRGEILHDNPVTACEESEDILDKVALVIRELLPVCHVLAQVNFLGRPENGHVLLVFRPNVVVTDWKDDEAVVGRG